MKRDSTGNSQRVALDFEIVEVWTGRSPHYRRFAVATIRA
jgi:hypothetical protein